MIARPDDLDDLERALLDAIERLPVPPTGQRSSGPLAPGSSLTAPSLDDVFEAQLDSRHLDHAARWLRAQGVGFYTIGSSGHEANALVADVLRPTDPALLHYRSGGFYLARARQVPGHDGVRDILLGLLASADEPIAGGRHKVFGHADLAVVPQTSTIASHLPRAMGVAFAIGRAARLGLETRWAPEAIAIASFGDASLNHSTAQGALNAASYTAHQGMADAAAAACARTTAGGSACRRRRRGSRPRCRGARACATSWPTAAIRSPSTTSPRSSPSTCGHGGAPPSCTCAPCGSVGTPGPTSSRRTGAPPACAPTRLATRCWPPPRVLVEAGAATPGEIVDRYLAGRARVRELAAKLLAERTVAGILGGRRRPAVAAAARCRCRGAPRRTPAPPSGSASSAAASRRTEGPLTLAETINRTLGDLLVAERPGARVRRGRRRQGRCVRRDPGPAAQGRCWPGSSTRCSTSSRSSASALGAGLSGLVPIPEIQYLAYLHNAEDQLRGEAASLSFFSDGQYRNPLVVRIAGYGYQKGFGGHFHNDNAVAVLRDIPGLVDRLAGPRRRRRADAALVRRGGRRRRDGQRVPRADRPVPHEATCTRPATTGGRRRIPRRRRGPTGTSPSVSRPSPARAATCSS